jgi:hypothetical protein
VRSQIKFYFHDCAIANYLALRKNLELGSEGFGKAVENFLDFILGDMEVAVECKATERVQPDHLRGLQTITQDFPNIRERFIVSLDTCQRQHKTA